MSSELLPLLIRVNEEIQTEPPRIRSLAIEGLRRWPGSLLSGHADESGSGLLNSLASAAGRTVKAGAPA
jgi:hypothetical protein